jgi:DNA replication and repair protein RecF
MGYISQLQLENFRNYQRAELNFQPGLTIFQGENGHGKTNLLEALFFTSLLRSFRCRNIQNLKRWQQESFSISSTLEVEGDLPDRLQVLYGDKRQLRINGNSIAKSSEFIRRVNAVSFTPEDIELIKGAAGERRQFIDILSTQLSPNYLQDLQNYTKALKSRNTLLRQVVEFGADENLLKTYSSILVECGSRLIRQRLDLLEKLETKIISFTSSMFPEQRKMKLIYQCSISKSPTKVADFRTDFEQKLNENLEKDKVRGATSCGPHRDDLLILLNGKSLGAFGSEGQCRLASLVLKMSSAEQLIEDKGTRNVILLIDDVLGELDSYRKEAFLQTIVRGDQIFIACTEVPEFCGGLKAKVFTVENGQAINREVLAE